MSDMIERVAAAIGDKVKPAFEGGKPVSLAEVARAAIEAMREPTDQMIVATEYVEVSSLSEFVTHGAAADTWRAMIDAALREKVDA